MAGASRGRVEAVTLTAIIIGANSEPVVHGRGRVKAWIEKAQELRQRNKEDEIEVLDLAQVIAATLPVTAPAAQEPAE